MKKALSIIMALLILASMAFTAYADENTATTYTITVDNSATGHTYEAYQIFAGDIYTDDDSETVFSNITWGANVSEDGKTALGEAVDVAATITDAAAASDFAAKIEAYLTGTPATGTYADGKYTISGLAAGYYLVKDADGSQAGKDDAYTSYILKVVKDVTVEPKTTTPTVQKKVKDINDSTETVLTDWQDSADYDIGDTVPFQLKATLGDSNMSYFETYTVVFHDTMSKGLTYKELVSIKVGDSDVASDDYVLESETDGDGTTTITITIKDVKTYGATAGTNVTVEYNATLNDKANIGSLGNPNVVYLEYSNNPNQVDKNGNGYDDSTETTDEGGSTTGEKIETGKTPDDKVIVFTYQTVVNKVNGEGNALAGAQFSLYKYNETTKKWDALDVTVNDAGTVFTVVGIDDGIYKIVETETPNGYNSIDDIYFVVEATHDVESDNPALNTLSANQCDATGQKFTTGVVATFTVTHDNGSISTNIVNNKGTTLPSTGGIGVTIFYVVGGLLMLAAVVVLVARKKVSAED